MKWRQQKSEAADTPNVGGAVPRSGRAGPSKVLDAFTVFSMGADTLDAEWAGPSTARDRPAHPTGPKEVWYDPGRSSLESPRGSLIPIFGRLDVKQMTHLST